MPWIDSSQCSGCGICAQNCPAEAIKIQDRKAELNQADCIRCGICHTACPSHAVRHDRELIRAEVSANREWIAQLRGHPHYADNPERQKQLTGRLKKHFNKTIKVAQQALEQLAQESA